MSNQNFFCDARGQRVALMACPSCKYHPCDKLDEEQAAELANSPMLVRSVESLLPQKIKMYVIKYQDGTLKEVPDLNPNAPDPELMEGIETVYQVNREWVPQYVLRPKSKSERQRIIHGENPGEDTEEADPIQVSFI